MAVDHGIDVFEEKFKTSAPVNPLFPNEENPSKRRGTERPEWAVFGKMTEKSENVLFRRKFFDWPDPVDLKPKTSQSIVHEKVCCHSSPLINAKGNFLHLSSVIPLKFPNTAYSEQSYARVQFTIKCL